MSRKAADPRWRKIEPAELKRVAVVAHCLDNQWVPRPMLAQMTRDGLSLEDVSPARAGYVRAEYLRALLTAQQVVVNRVYFYNNSLISRDFLAPGPSRKAFAALLRSGAIVPHLHKEESPLETPGGNMDLVSEGFKAWVEVCREAEQFSVNRLSWNKTRNNELTYRLALAFQEFAQNLAGRARSGGAAEFARHLGLRADQADEFRTRLQKLRRWAIENDEAVADDPDSQPLTRNAVYKTFVTPDGDTPTSGRCDPAKPFSKEIKQLVDLQYNTGLPEFLDRLPLRPVHTLHRAALRENVPEHRDPGAAGPADLEKALRSKIAFDTLSDDLDPFSTASLLSLDLPSIVRIRKSDAWRTYTSQLAGLVDEPEMFDTRADSVLKAYQELLRLLARGRPRLPWQSVRQSHLEISGVTLKVTFSSRPSFQQTGEITGEPPPCQATVRLAMVNRLSQNDAGSAQDKAEPDLAFDALRANIADPRSFLEQIKRTLRADGFRELSAETDRDQSLGGMEQEQQQP
jgi:hypothetical protein